MEGTVKWYNDMKSYGFIQVEDGKDVFVHRNSLPEGTTLREGDKVEFEIEQTPKGPQAINVKKL
jgi:CspA family cold shock protein